MPDNGYVLAGLLTMLAVTLALRAAPFAVLSRLRDSGLITFLAATMPTGVMVILTAYTLRDLTPATALPAALGITATAALHLWRRNALLSILTGTAVYLLAQHLL